MGVSFVLGIARDPTAASPPGSSRPPVALVALVLRPGRGMLGDAADELGIVVGGVFFVV